MLDPRENQSLFAAGDLIRARFRVTELLGAGGMAEVYKAEDLSTGRRVALKVVLPELLGSEKTRTRFEREVEWTRGIDHPNVIRIHELLHLPAPAGRVSRDSIPCVVMEFLRGQTLADRLEAQGPIDCIAARPIVCQVAAALAAAHRRRIVHRDLKPDNIFLEPDDRSERVVLTDFGVARKIDRWSGDPDASAESLTASNILVGTPDYMAPEMLDLEEAIPASDTYALGLVFYEMVTGRRPFDTDLPLQALFKRVRQPVPSPAEIRPDLDPVCERVILDCLRRKPGDRFSDVEDVIRELDGPDSAYLLPPLRRIRKEHFFVAGMVLGIVLAVILVVVLYAGK